MELPHIGKYCHEKTCHRLDFLPMKCDACSNIFCSEHFQYEKHSCENPYPNNVQVPVCPLCNKPVPSKRGEQPDIAVSEHIDRDCQADPAVSKRKLYTNKCSVKGCKIKDVVKITCDKCVKIYCLTHRHPDDHKCEERKVPSPAQAAGAAAMARAQAQNAKKSKFSWLTCHSSASSLGGRSNASTLPEISVNAVQGSMSEDEALALALHKSMNESKPKSVQEQEDRLLAQALAECDQDQSVLQRPRERSCSVS